MAVYILADANFCQSDSRDSDLILNWNSVVKEDDLVLLLGDIIYRGANCSWEYIEQIFDNLIGKKKVIGIAHDEEGATEWETITRHKCFKVNAAVPGQINGEDQVVNIYSYSSDTLKRGRLNERNCYGAAPRSILGQETIYENNILSLSTDDWGLMPIEYMRIPQMIDDILLLNKMEEVNV